METPRLPQETVLQVVEPLKELPQVIARSREQDLMAIEVALAAGVAEGPLP